VTGPPAALVAKGLITGSTVREYDGISWKLTSKAPLRRHDLGSSRSGGVFCIARSPDRCCAASSSATARPAASNRRTNGLLNDADQIAVGDGGQRRAEGGNDGRPENGRHRRGRKPGRPALDGAPDDCGCAPPPAEGIEDCGCAPPAAGGGEMRPAAASRSPSASTSRPALPSTAAPARRALVRTPARTVGDEGQYAGDQR